MLFVSGRFELKLHLQERMFTMTLQINIRLVQTVQITVHTTESTKITINIKLATGLVVLDNIRRKTFLKQK